MATKRLSSACGYDEEIQGWLEFFAVAVRAWFRLPRERYVGGEKARKFLRSMAWANTYMLALWLVSTVYAGNDS